MPAGGRVVLGLAFVLLVAATAGAQARTEQDLVELIVREGPQARAIRAAAEAVRREHEARTALPNPAVGYSREGAGTTEFLQIEQAIPLFGSRAALARAGVAAAEAADAERDARLWRLRADAAAAIARFAAEHQRLAAARATVTAIEALLEILRVREREGEGSRFDRIRAEQELVDVRASAVAAEVAAGVARAEVMSLLPAETPAPAPPGDVFAPREIPSADALMERATRSRAELRALERASQRFALEADASRRSRLPSPTLAAGLKRAEVDDSRTGTGALFGLRLSVPLFDTGARDAARWRAEQSRADAERLAARGEIRATVAGAAQSALLRQQAVAAMEAATASADDLVAIADAAYRDGEIGIVELLDARRAAARARDRVLNARLDARLAQIALERAVGETLWP